MKNAFPVLLVAAGWLLEAASAGTDRYVDDLNGRDDAAGDAPATAWRSLARVNDADLKPGDTVRFRRGGTWRGQLVPHSGDEGAPITYTTYGEGPRPLLLGSVNAARPDLWREGSSNHWKTVCDATERDLPLDLAPGRWSLHAEGGAKATRSLDGNVLRIACTAAGTAPNHLQLSLMPFGVTNGAEYVFEARVRCTKPCRLSRLSLMKAGAPWSSYGQVTGSPLDVGPEWTCLRVVLAATTTATDGRITLFLGDVLPADSTFEFEPRAWRVIVARSFPVLGVDVGNIVFDGGVHCGVKKWAEAELREPGDYWYCAADGAVVLCATGNPALVHRDIELALTRHIVNEGGRHHVVYDGLDLRYGAAHGIGGGDTHHIVVRDCDLSFIGGGHQHTRPDGKPVRYGNGVEFWANAHDNLVERCRIWEVYDAALTNQGFDDNEQRSIVYRDNAIWSAEYSFEYWNRGTSKTRDILFEHNTCFAAGRGWGHDQRPDPNGRHLMFYNNTADTKGVVVRANIFCDATESILRMQNDWTAGLKMERNCWFQQGDVIAWFLKDTFAPARFEDYRAKSGLDAGSIRADPQFENAAARDFRLSPGSPAQHLAADGGPAGARFRQER